MNTLEQRQKSSGTSGSLIIAFVDDSQTKHVNYIQDSLISVDQVLKKSDNKTKKLTYF